MRGHLVTERLQVVRVALGELLFGLPETQKGVPGVDSPRGASTGLFDGVRAFPAGFEGAWCGPVGTEGRVEGAGKPADALGALPFA